MMWKTRRYCFWGVATMASAEFQGNVLLRGSIVNFCLALVLYAVLSLIARLVGRWVQSDLWFYIGGGLFGLLIVEWWLVGFYPGSGKPGIHVAMFTNWAAVFTVPRLFTSRRADADVRHRVKRTILVYSFLAPVLVVALPIPPGGTVAILMTLYSLTLSFLFVPFLTDSRSAAGRMRIVLSLCVLGAILNILTW